MKKIRFLAVAMALLFLLAGCQKKEEDLLKLESLFERTEVAMQEGHLFFAGKVLSVTKKSTAITYYESETAANTFYEVEVTEDFFDCLPDRILTLCVMGTDENFVSRTELKEEKEYLFSANVWAGEDALIFLLPTFYEALPQREGEYIYYTKGNLRYAVDGDYADYKETLLQLAQEHSYNAKKVGAMLKANLQSASEKDAAYFEKLKFKNIDGAALNQTAAFAKKKSESLKAIQTWQEVREVLQ